MITQLFEDHLQAQGDDRGIVSVQQIPTGMVLWSSEKQMGRHYQPVTVLSWSSNGRYLASGSSDASVKVWDGATGVLLQTYAKHTAEVCALAWAPDNERIVSSAHHESPHVWSLHLPQEKISQQ